MPVPVTCVDSRCLHARIRRTSATTEPLATGLGRKLNARARSRLVEPGSLAAALTNSTIALIAARAFTGIAAAMILPSTLSLITTTFEDDERLRAFSIWGVYFSLGFCRRPLFVGFYCNVDHGSLSFSSISP